MTLKPEAYKMKYFSIAELSRSTTALKQGIDNTPPPEVTPALTALIRNVLDPAREELGRPITVTSGYRCPGLNSAVNGAPTSQHLRGEAADMDAGSRTENQRLFKIIRDSLPFDQLINEQNFSWVHVSFRASGTNRRQLLKID